MLEEHPCFDFWFTTKDGKLLDFEDDNHGVGYIYGLPLNVVWDVIEGIKDNLEGNYHEDLQVDGIKNVRVAGISYFGGQWSEAACAWEIHPDYWYSVEFKATP